MKIAFFRPIYIYIFSILSWAYFKDSFALMKKIETCVALKWILYILWAYLIYHMLHILQICAYTIFCLIDMFFLSVYVSADTYTANKVKKKKKNIYYKYFWPGTRSFKIHILTFFFGGFSINACQVKGIHHIFLSLFF